MTHFKFPSIEQYRNAVRTVKDRCEYHSEPLPIVNFVGTVKLHGTNASVVFDVQTEKIWAQSRERIISVEDDNMQFAAFIRDNEILFPRSL